MESGYSLHQIEQLLTESLREHEIAVIKLSNNEHTHQPFDESICSILEHKSDLFFIALVLEGEATLNVNFQQYTFSKNDMIIALSDAAKRLRSIKSTAVIQLVVFNSGLPLKLNTPEYFLDYAQYYFSSEFKPIWNLSHEEADNLKMVINQLQRYITVANKKLFGKNLLNGMFNVFLYELGSLAASYAPPLLVQSSRKKQLFLNFYRMAKKNFKQYRKISFYAGRLFVTPKYLSEIVKEYSGNTAGQLIDSFVIREARSLLAMPDLTISQVADILHFSDSSFFGKYFKRHTGVSPKGYREQKGQITLLIPNDELLSSKA
ncbi:helix-turn-helix domain-containing protein [Parapedobacter tibetensis]|uniref:helix-turn-helix domain-containing protein n=1 Tax=Parapedobacter tibetensis TaxID=2972951 RepID=UPI00214D3CD2|nr:helix-turn-helix domain-containing protein [Parapedobacter tibetensis]